MEDLIKRTHQTTRVHIKTIPQGIKISISNREELSDLLSKIPYFFVMMMLTLVGFPLIYGLFLLLKFKQELQGESGAWEVLLGMCSVGFCFWGWAELQAFYDLFGFGKERIIFSHEKMHISKTFFGIAITTAHYEMRKIHNVRLALGKRHLLFDYAMHDKTQRITCCQGIKGKGIDMADADILVKQVSEIVKFHCHSVKHIIFGTSPLSHSDSYTTLQNPEVSELTFPFAHLKQLSIETETYDFHQVERFLTYAVNYIGQEYLKGEVEVHLYGDPEKLHPNLRNSLTNLCKQVYVSPERDK